MQAFELAKAGELDYLAIDALHMMAFIESRLYDMRQSYLLTHREDRRGCKALVEDLRLRDLLGVVGNGLTCCVHRIPVLTSLHEFWPGKSEAQKRRRPRLRRRVCFGAQILWFESFDRKARFVEQ